MDFLPLWSQNQRGAVSPAVCAEMVGGPVWTSGWAAPRGPSWELLPLRNIELEESFILEGLENELQVSILPAYSVSWLMCMHRGGSLLLISFYFLFCSCRNFANYFPGLLRSLRSPWSLCSLWWSEGLSLWEGLGLQPSWLPNLTLVSDSAAEICPCWWATSASKKRKRDMFCVRKEGKEKGDSFLLSYECIAFNSYEEEKVFSNLSISDQALKRQWLSYGDSTNQGFPLAPHLVLILAESTSGQVLGPGKVDLLFGNWWATSSLPRKAGMLLLCSCEQPCGPADPPTPLTPPPPLAAWQGLVPPEKFQAY